mmetsp:Transcript_11720/g.11779  ORF Transcript_11720/g.11779 Transcript_11720/m.11779 type:complete len:226 (-) Transcript_11720:333-1010(-)
MPKAIKAEAANDATAVIPITNASESVVVDAIALLPSAVTPRIRRRASYTTPLRAGPRMKASVLDASLSASNCGRIFFFSSFSSLLASLLISAAAAAPTSAKYALLTGLLPAKQPVRTRMAKNKPKPPPPNIPLPPLITKLCAKRPNPLPNKLIISTGFRPTVSLNRGHRKTPNSIPSGYADVSEPNLAEAVCNPKCWPSIGVIGPAIVNPNRLRKEDVKIVRTEI